MDLSRWELSHRDFKYPQISKHLRRMLTLRYWGWMRWCRRISMRDRVTIRWLKSYRRHGITTSITISRCLKVRCNKFRLKTSATTFRAHIIWYITSRCRWHSNLNRNSRIKREWWAMLWVRIYILTWEWTRQSLAITIKCRDLTIIIDNYIFYVFNFSLFNIILW